MENAEEGEIIDDDVTNFIREYSLEETYADIVNDNITGKAYDPSDCLDDSLAQETNFPSDNNKIEDYSSPSDTDSCPGLPFSTLSLSQQPPNTDGNTDNIDDLDLGELELRRLALGSLLAKDETDSKNSSQLQKPSIPPDSFTLPRKRRSSTLYKHRLEMCQNEIDDIHRERKQAEVNFKEDTLSQITNIEPPPDESLDVLLTSHLQPHESVPSNLQDNLDDVPMEMANTDEEDFTEHTDHAHREPILETLPTLSIQPVDKTQNKFTSEGWIVEEGLSITSNESPIVSPVDEDPGLPIPTVIKMRDLPSVIPLPPVSRYLDSIVPPPPPPILGTQSNFLDFAIPPLIVGCSVPEYQSLSVFNLPPPPPPPPPPALYDYNYVPVISVPSDDPSQFLDSTVASLPTSELSRAQKRHIAIDEDDDIEEDLLRQRALASMFFNRSGDSKSKTASSPKRYSSRTSSSTASPQNRENSKERSVRNSKRSKPNPSPKLDNSKNSIKKIDERSVGNRKSCVVNLLSNTPNIKDKMKPLTSCTKAISVMKTPQKETSQMTKMNSSNYSGNSSSKAQNKRNKLQNRKVEVLNKNIKTPPEMIDKEVYINISSESDSSKPLTKSQRKKRNRRNRQLMQIAAKRVTQQGKISQNNFPSTNKFKQITNTQCASVLLELPSFSATNSSVSDQNSHRPSHYSKVPVNKYALTRQSTSKKIIPTERSKENTSNSKPDITYTQHDKKRDISHHHLNNSSSCLSSDKNLVISVTNNSYSLPVTGITQSVYSFNRNSSVETPVYSSSARHSSQSLESVSSYHCRRTIVPHQQRRFIITLGNSSSEDDNYEPVKQQDVCMVDKSSIDTFLQSCRKSAEESKRVILSNDSDIALPTQIHTIDNLLSTDAHMQDATVDNLLNCGSTNKTENNEKLSDNLSLLPYLSHNTHSAEPLTDSSVKEKSLPSCVVISEIHDTVEVFKTSSNSILTHDNLGTAEVLPPLSNSDSLSVADSFVYKGLSQHSSNLCTEAICTKIDTANGMSLLSNVKGISISDASDKETLLSLSRTNSASSLLASALSNDVLLPIDTNSALSSISTSTMKKNPVISTHTKASINKEYLRRKETFLRSRLEVLHKKEILAKKRELRRLKQKEIASLRQRLTTLISDQKRLDQEIIQEDKNLFPLEAVMKQNSKLYKSFVNIVSEKFNINLTASNVLASTPLKTDVPFSKSIKCELPGKCFHLLRILEQGSSATCHVHALIKTVNLSVLFSTASQFNALLSNETIVTDGASMEVISNDTSEALLETESQMEDCCPQSLIENTIFTKPYTSDNNLAQTDLNAQLNCENLDTLTSDAKIPYSGITSFIDPPSSPLNDDNQTYAHSEISSNCPLNSSIDDSLQNESNQSFTSQHTFTKSDSIIMSSANYVNDTLIPDNLDDNTSESNELIINTEIIELPILFDKSFNNSKTDKNLQLKSNIVAKSQPDSDVFIDSIELPQTAPIAEYDFSVRLPSDKNKTVHSPISCDTYITKESNKSTIIGPSSTNIVDKSKGIIDIPPKSSSVVNKSIAHCPSSNHMSEETTIKSEEIRSNKDAADSQSISICKTWDVNEVICPFLLSGECRDNACEFQHPDILKTDSTNNNLQSVSHMLESSSQLMSQIYNSAFPQNSLTDEPIKSLYLISNYKCPACSTSISILTTHLISDVTCQQCVKRAREISSMDPNYVNTVLDLVHHTHFRIARRKSRGESIVALLDQLISYLWEFIDKSIKDCSVLIKHLLYAIHLKANDDTKSFVQALEKVTYSIDVSIFAANLCCNYKMKRHVLIKSIQNNFSRATDSDKIPLLLLYCQMESMTGSSKKALSFLLGIVKRYKPTPGDTGLSVSEIFHIARIFLVWTLLGYLPYIWPSTLQGVKSVVILEKQEILLTIFSILFPDIVTGSNIKEAVSQLSFNSNLIYVLHLYIDFLTVLKKYDVALLLVAELCHTNFSESFFVDMCSLLHRISQWDLEDTSYLKKYLCDEETLNFFYPQYVYLNSCWLLKKGHVERCRHYLEVFSRWLHVSSSVSSSASCHDLYLHLLGLKEYSLSVCSWTPRFRLVDLQKSKSLVYIWLNFGLFSCIANITDGILVYFERICLSHITSPFHIHLVMIFIIDLCAELSQRGYIPYYQTIKRVVLREVKWLHSSLMQESYLVEVVQRIQLSKLTHNQREELCTTLIDVRPFNVSLLVALVKMLFALEGTKIDHFENRQLALLLCRSSSFDRPLLDEFWLLYLDIARITCVSSDEMRTILNQAVESVPMSRQLWKEFHRFAAEANKPGLRQSVEQKIKQSGIF